MLWLNASGTLVAVVCVAIGLRGSKNPEVVDEAEL
jgi:hypothetical protein